MDLWILSQNKDQLVKTNVVRCVTTSDIRKTKQIYIITNNEYDFGIYETRERALEVLDEIQKLLVYDLLVFTNTDFEEGLADYVKPYNTIAVQDKNNLASSVEFVHRDCVVYEMPQN